MSDRGNPMLEGNFAPIGIECEASHLAVVGEIPRGLNGTLFRNGPNPQFTPIDPLRHHWFVGDGMIHAFTLDNGRASYRNRWVRTAKWRAENAAGAALGSGFGGPAKPGVAIANEGVANTNIIWHAGRLLALEEQHLPIELDPSTLATRGVQNFGALQGPFTAHPKKDPATGELLFFGYSATGPLTRGMSYGTLAPDGRVTRFEYFEAPYCSMVHDFVVTEKHVLFPILPLSGSLARAKSGSMPYAWEPALGAHIGLIERASGASSLRWFRAENCYVFHVLNAWEEEGRIFADVIQYDAPPLFPRVDGGNARADLKGRLVRWTLDPAAGTDAFQCSQLDEMTGEFPRFDERRAGLRHRFGTFAGYSAGDNARLMMDTIAWLDLASGRRSTFTLPDGDATSEPVFVPRSDEAAEGDGWLLATVWRSEERRSDLIILDTDHIERGPVATVQLPHRVPFGFHGNWVSAAA